MYKIWQQAYKDFTGYHFTGEDSDLCRASFYAFIPLACIGLLILALHIKTLF